MKQNIYHIINLASAVLLAGVLPSSCVYDDGGDLEDVRPASIAVNAMAVGVGPRAVSEADDHTFMVLFWEDNAHLEDPGNNAKWPGPYLAAHAPQPVDFYDRFVFDTRYPYPSDDAKLYATGYAPGSLLVPDNSAAGYRKIRVVSMDSKLEYGRYDFLGCDVWSDVYRGSLSDPFAQDKNKLYFRHLAAKLIFYADRNKADMENKQYVRNVRVTNLRMSIDGNKWIPMHTPSEFEWKTLDDNIDFTPSYREALDSAKRVDGNKGVNTVPLAGYKAVKSVTFGTGHDFVLQRHDSDRVPVSGMSIDSCYVCNPIVNGAVSIDQPIRLKMDITADLSFDPNFAMGDADGSVTDDLTFTRTWEGVTLSEIRCVDKDGNVVTTGDPVKEFKPGNEYRVYIHFHRTGVNLAALEMNWNFGGVHYITIPGGEQTGGQQPTDQQPTTNDQQTNNPI